MRNSSADSSGGPLTRALSLSDCALVFAFPTSESEFYRSAHPGRFAGRWALWERYADKVLGSDADVIQAQKSQRKYPSRLHRIEQLAMKGGLTFKANATFEDFRSLMCSHYNVVALMAHFEQKKMIEFSDKFVSPQLLSSAIPNDFSGVLHMSCCYSVKLTEIVKQRSDSCVVGWFPYYESVEEWLSMHTAAFLLLADRRVNTYYEAWNMIEQWQRLGKWQ